MLFLTPVTSFLAVAMTGILVVWRRWRVRWKPIPLLAGQTNDQAMFASFQLSLIDAEIACKESGCSHL